MAADAQVSTVAPLEPPSFSEYELELKDVEPSELGGMSASRRFSGTEPAVPLSCSISLRKPRRKLAALPCLGGSGLKTGLMLPPDLANGSYRLSACTEYADIVLLSAGVTIAGHSMDLRTRVLEDWDTGG